MIKVLKSSILVLLLSCGLCWPALRVQATAITPTDTAAPVPTIVDYAEDGRALYDRETRPNFATINSVVGADYERERYFLTSINEEGQVTQGDSDEVQSLTVGENFEVQIYVCNNSENVIASRVFTDELKVHLHVPEIIDGAAVMTATITAANTTPQSAACNLRLQSDQAVQLEYVAGSAHWVSLDTSNNAQIERYELFGKGAMVGSNTMSGILLNGEEHAGWVSLQFTVVAAGKTVNASSDKAEQDITDEPVAGNRPETASVDRPVVGEEVFEVIRLMLCINTIAGVILVVITVAVAPRVKQWWRDEN